MLLALMGRAFGRVAGVTAGLAALLVGLQVVVVLIAASQERSQSFDLIQRMAPGFAQRAFGSTLSAFLSFGGLVNFAYFHPVVILMLALFAAYVATELAADVEDGQVDLLLSRPIARYWLVTRSLALAIAIPLVIVLMMMASTWLALIAFAPPGARWPTASSLALMAAHLVALSWWFGTAGLAAGSVARRRLNAMGPVAIIAVSMFLLELLGGAWAPIAWTTPISPFHYFQGAAVMAGTADSARDFLVLGSASLAFTALAYWRFHARDV